MGSAAERLPASAMIKREICPGSGLAAIWVVSWVTRLPSSAGFREEAAARMKSAGLRAATPTAADCRQGSLRSA